MLNITVFKAIVKTIIGEIFLKPELDEDEEEMEPTTKTTALKLFKQQPDGSYVVKIKYTILSNLVLKLSSFGLSFRQNLVVFAHHKEAFGNARLAGISDHGVGEMVRVSVSANLQVL